MQHTLIKQGKRKYCDLTGKYSERGYHFLRVSLEGLLEMEPVQR